jgi:hypothetical protein
VRDNIAAVVEAGGTYDSPPHKFPKGIIEDIASNIIKMIVNQDFSSGLEPGPVLDYFPYLSPPPAS